MSSKKLLLSIDQGTTSSRVILFDSEGKTWPQVQKGHRQIFPQAGWCEHDPVEICTIIHAMIKELVERMPGYGLNVADIKGIGVTNQRETTIVWDKLTGKPLHNALVWHDTRTSEIVDRFIKENNGDKFAFAQKTGLPLSTYFSAFKLRWLIEHVPEVSKAIEEGRCLFGTMDSWIIWNLTGGVNGGIHMTDITNASRTFLFNLHTSTWDPELCAMFGIPLSILPSIRSNSEIYGPVFDGPLKGVPIAGCIGDQQSALLGHKGLHDGDAKVTYGTGCFLLMNTGSKIIHSKHGLITTVGLQLGAHGTVTYALEGSVATAGAAVQWMTKNFKGIDQPSDIGPLASLVEDTGGIVFVPSFAGFFAPRWESEVRAGILGISLQATPSHFARALEEGICQQVREVLSVMSIDNRFSSNLNGPIAKNADDESKQAIMEMANTRLQPVSASIKPEEGINYYEEEEEKDDDSEEKKKRNNKGTKTKKEEEKVEELLTSPEQAQAMGLPTPVTISSPSSTTTHNEKQEEKKEEKEAKIEPKDKENSVPMPARVLVDGGPTNDSFLMQLQSDLLSTILVRPTNVESTALGAAISAGLATGVWKNVEEMEESIPRSFVEWKPIMKDDVREKLIRQWEHAVKNVIQYGVFK